MTEKAKVNGNSLTSTSEGTLSDALVLLGRELADREALSSRACPAREETLAFLNGLKSDAAVQELIKKTPCCGSNWQTGLFPISMPGPRYNQRFDLVMHFGHAGEEYEIGIRERIPESQWTPFMFEENQSGPLTVVAFRTNVPWDMLGRNSLPRCPEISLKAVADVVPLTIVRRALEEAMTRNATAEADTLRRRNQRDREKLDVAD